MRDRALRSRLADRGYREAITYSFVDPALQRQLFPGVRALALANPISARSRARCACRCGRACAALRARTSVASRSRVRLFEHRRAAS